MTRFAAPIAVACAAACAPSFLSSYAPAAADDPARAPDAGSAVDLARDPIDAALDAIREGCARGQTIQGECAAKAKDACEGMTRLARACFDAAEPKVTCESLEGRAGAGARSRAVGERSADAIAGICEAACEARQTGRRWDDMKAQLDALCGPR